MNLDTSADLEVIQNFGNAAAVHAIAVALQQTAITNVASSQPTYNAPSQVREVYPTQILEQPRQSRVPMVCGLTVVTCLAMLIGWLAVTATAFLAVGFVVLVVFALLCKMNSGRRSSQSFSGTFQGRSH
jgi:hypothetical protein